eukprot:2322321-Pyramimonas_sp.AAC.1
MTWSCTVTCASEQRMHITYTGVASNRAAVAHATSTYQLNGTTPRMKPANESRQIPLPNT